MCGGAEWICQGSEEAAGLRCWSVAGNVIREEMGPYRARDLLGIRAEIKSRGWAGEAKSGGQRREVESFGMALTPTKGWNLTQKLFSSHGGGAFPGSQTLGLIPNRHEGQIPTSSSLQSHPNWLRTWNSNLSFLSHISHYFVDP